MTIRQRQRRKLTSTNAYWLRRRPLVLEFNDIDSLPKAEEFWRHEPGIPDDLRVQMSRYRHLMMPEPMAEDYKARRAELLQRRRDWLLRQPPE